MPRKRCLENIRPPRFSRAHRPSASAGSKTSTASAAMAPAHGGNLAEMLKAVDRAEFTCLSDAHYGGLAKHARRIEIGQHAIQIAGVDQAVAPIDTDYPRTVRVHQRGA